MTRRFKRSTIKQIRASYSYKPNTSVKSEEKKVYMRLAQFSLIIFLFAVVLYIWGTDLVAFIGSIWTTPGNASANITPSVMLPPQLQGIPLLTNDKEIIISGSTTPGVEITIYINNNPLPVVLADESGGFSYPQADLIEGNNSIYAIASKNDIKSDPSNVISISLDTKKPELNYDAAVDSASGTVTFSGQVESGASLYVNDRRIIVQADGTFSTEFILSAGDNAFNIMVEDQAGNITNKTETIPYETSLPNP